MKKIIESNKSYNKALKNTEINYHLIENKYNLAKLHELGYTADDLKEAGYTLKELVEKFCINNKFPKDDKEKRKLLCKSGFDFPNLLTKMDFTPYDIIILNVKYYKFVWGSCYFHDPGDFHNSSFHKIKPSERKKMDDEIRKNWSKEKIKKLKKMKIQKN